MITNANSVSLADAGFTGRIIAALNRANAYTVGDVRNMTDFQLSKIRQFGEKCFAEVNRRIPDRIRERDGEKENWRTAENVMQILERGAAFAMIPKGFSISDPEIILLNHCIGHPEAVDRVMKILEAQKPSPASWCIELLYEKLKNIRDGFAQFGLDDVGN